MAATSDSAVVPPPGDDLAWSGSPEPSGPGRGPGRTVVRAALVLALLAGVVVLLVNVVPMFGPSTGTGRQGAAPASTSPSARATSPRPSASTETSASATPSATRSTPSPTPTPTSKSPTPTKSPSPSPTESKDESDEGKPSASDLGRAVRTYYDAMPDDLDAGWSRLTSSYQRNQSGGRSSYERFWGSIDRVSVSKAKGDPPDKAEATITYRFKDGRVVRERTSYRLVDDNGDLKINSSKVLSSSTTRG